MKRVHQMGTKCFSRTKAVSITTIQKIKNVFITFWKIPSKGKNWFYKIVIHYFVRISSLWWWWFFLSIYGLDLFFIDRGNKIIWYLIYISTFRMGVHFRNVTDCVDEFLFHSNHIFDAYCLRFSVCQLSIGSDTFCHATFRWDFHRWTCFIHLIVLCLSNRLIGIYRYSCEVPFHCSNLV